MKNSFEGITENLIDLVLEFWKELKAEEEYDRSDWIRKRLRELGIQIDEAESNYRLVTPLDEKPEKLFSEEMKRFSEMANESLSVFIKRRKDWIRWMYNYHDMLSSSYGFKYRRGIHYFFIYKVKSYQKNYNNHNNFIPKDYRFVYQQKTSDNHKDWNSSTPIIHPESWDAGILNVWESYFPDIISRLESFMEYRGSKQKSFQVDDYASADWAGADKDYKLSHKSVSL